MSIDLLDSGYLKYYPFKLTDVLTPLKTQLFSQVFKPLRVNKKHFKELVREAKVMNLEEGDIYAVEDVSPADERLSILLKGR